MYYFNDTLSTSSFIIIANLTVFVKFNARHRRKIMSFWSTRHFKILAYTAILLFATASDCLVSGKVATKNIYTLETAIKKIIAGVYPEVPNI
jgi:hypothetical protein